MNRPTRPTNTESLIRELEDQRYAAMLAGNVAALEQLCADELIYTHSNAERDDKRSLLRKVADGTFTYRSISHPIETVAIFDSTAVVAGQMIAEVVIAGTPRLLNNQSLAVWIRVGERWRLAAYQPTVIPNP